MKRLNIKTKPDWMALDCGVRLLVAPYSSFLLLSANSDSRLVSLPEGTPDDFHNMVLGKVLADMAIVDWDGVGDEVGEELDFSPEALSTLMNDVEILGDFMVKFMGPMAEQELEKNGSSPLLNGNSAGAESIAAPAEQLAPSAPET